METKDVTVDKQPRIGKYQLIAIITLWSALVLLIQSKNSPLYVLNDWVDLNAFLTVGKSWANDLIPYRDLFEQKGPSLFYIFFLISKIKASYVLIYLAEILFFSSSLWLLYKIARFYYQTLSSLIFVFLSSLLLTLSPYFVHGGSSEEFAYPFITYSLYLLFQFYHRGIIQRYQWLLFGIACALVFWNKYTMIGVFMGVFIGIMLTLMIRKDYQKILEACLTALLGFMLITAIIIVYFYSKDALRDLYEAYFHSNIKLYSNNHHVGFVGKVINSFVLFFEQLQQSNLLFFTMIIGLYGLISQSKILTSPALTLNYFFVLCSMIVTTFYGGKAYDYYLLAVLPILSVALLPIVGHFKQRTLTNFETFMVGLVTLFLIVGTGEKITESKLFPHNKTMSLDGSTNQSAQQIFADIINQEDKPTLLNYGALDMGFYQSSNLLPNNYYFHKVNIAYDQLPEMMDEQNELVNEQRVMFIVMRQRVEDGERKIPKNIKQNYKLVKKHSQFFVYPWYYYLYQSKNSIDK